MGTEPAEQTAQSSAARRSRLTGAALGSLGWLLCLVGFGIYASGYDASWQGSIHPAFPEYTFDSVAQMGLSVIGLAHTSFAAFIVRRWEPIPRYFIGWACVTCAGWFFLTTLIRYGWPVAYVGPELESVEIVVLGLGGGVVITFGVLVIAWLVVAFHRVT
ncbi:MAG: hypothetical protein ABEN55_14665 [Bradymonadaceae bacterium]